MDQAQHRTGQDKAQQHQDVEGQVHGISFRDQTKVRVDQPEKGTWQINLGGRGLRLISHVPFSFRDQTKVRVDQRPD